MEELWEGAVQGSVWDAETYLLGAPGVRWNWEFGQGGVRPRQNF